MNTKTRKSYSEESKLANKEFFVAMDSTSGDIYRFKTKQLLDNWVKNNI